MRAVLVLVCLALAGPTQAARRGTRRLGAAELEPLARAAVAAALPEGVRVRRVVVPALSVPDGELRVEVVSPPPSRTGRYPVALLVSAGDDRPQRLAALADLEAPARPLVARGAAVSVVVRCPGILVSTRGTLQAAAAVGESAAVLTTGGRRVLSGTLVDSQTVEVSP